MIDDVAGDMAEGVSAPSHATLLSPEEVADEVIDDVAAEVAEGVSASSAALALRTLTLDAAASTRAPSVSACVDAARGTAPGGGPAALRYSTRMRARVDARESGVTLGLEPLSSGNASGLPGTLQGCTLPWATVEASGTSTRTCMRHVQNIDVARRAAHASFCAAIAWVVAHASST